MLFHTSLIREWGVAIVGGHPQTPATQSRKEYFSETLAAHRSSKAYISLKLSLFLKSSVSLQSFLNILQLRIKNSIKRSNFNEKITLQNPYSTHAIWT